MKIKKKGQELFGMSFSTIFSIIIIIFIVAVAFIAIRHFVNLSKCSSVGLFYDDLREKVRDAWSSSSGRYESYFEGKLPNKGMFGTKITHICFGKLSDTPRDNADREKLDNLITDYTFDRTDSYNVFVYPPDEGCDSGLGAITLKCGSAECVTTENKFFCVPVEDNKVKVRMTKQSDQYQITLQKP